MKILLAVSGGADSIYLASRAGDFFPGAEFAAAHCNFSLRGAESDGDEQFVRDWCASKGITLFCKRFDTQAYASQNGISVEMAARDLRYAWFAQLCHEQGFQAVAVAHNANDNAETLMLNLLRGTGSRGLRGMGAQSEIIAGGKPLTILRPMLEISRPEIEATLMKEGTAWREDSTNRENDARRNKIRNLVFPVFAEINPSFLRTLGRDMDHFCQADDIAEDYFRNSGLSMEVGVDIRKLLSLKHWEYILFRLLEPYNLSEETFGKLVELLKSGRTISGKVFQSPTHIVFIERKTLSAKPRESREALYSNFIIFATKIFSEGGNREGLGSE